jgi:hypothetical protein
VDIIDDGDDDFISVSSSPARYVEYTPAAYPNGNGATYPRATRIRSAIRTSIEADTEVRISRVYRAGFESVVSSA